jgi:hypothetical protein
MNNDTLDNTIFHIIGDNYEILNIDGKIIVRNANAVQVENSLTTVVSGGNVKILGNCNIDINGTLDLTADRINIKSRSELQISADSHLKITGATINLN